MASAEHFLTAFSKLQPLPLVVSKLSQLIASDMTTLKDLEEVIKVDPILVARVLRVVNSAYFSLVQKVDGIGRAIAYLGMKNLYALTVTDSLQTLCGGLKQQNSPHRTQIWRHSAAVSSCAKMIAERIFGINGDDAYLTGILHDFGLAVEEQVAHQQFTALIDQAANASELLALEQQHFGTDHCQIAAVMCRQWQMSEAIAQAIELHHQQFTDIDPASLGGILQISEYLLSQTDESGLASLNATISPALIDHLEANSDEYAVLMDDFPGEMAKANELYGLSG